MQTCLNIHLHCGTAFFFLPCSPTQVALFAQLREAGHLQDPETPVRLIREGGGAYRVTVTPLAVQSACSELRPPDLCYETRCLSDEVRLRRRLLASRLKQIS